MKVKFVDGVKIRNTIDTDWGASGTHEYYLYIPRGELWLDRGLRGEKDFFVRRTILEQRNRKLPFSEIRRLAGLELTDPTTKEPREEKRTRRGRLAVRYLDGAAIRRKYDPYFELGGHALVYAYIPKNEIWIDARSDSRDWPYTLIHEQEELRLMKRDQSYDDAHDFALAAERAARRKDGVANFLRG